MEIISIKSLFEKEFIGKQLKFCTLDMPIYTQKSIWVKKSHNVTDKQFSEGNPKFRMLSTSKKVIGRHKIFEIETIVGIDTVYGADYGDDNIYAVFKLRNGNTHEVNATYGLTKLSENLFIEN